MSGRNRICVEEGMYVDMVMFVWWIVGSKKKEQAAELGRIVE